MDFETVFTVKKEIAEETFLRQVLVKIAKDTDTPIDIVHAEFSDVKESCKEVILCEAQVEGTCSASVGYDRQEPYIAYEKYKEKVGDSYVERERPVTKYKTVTDWQIFSTAYEGTATCAACNSSTGGLDLMAAVALKTANRENIAAEGEAQINSDALRRVVDDCKHEVERWKVSLPGDRQKDVRYRSNADITSLSCFILPFYEVSFTYEGKTYQAWGFACGEVYVSCSALPKDQFDIVQETKDRTADLKKKTEGAWRIFWIALLVAIGGFFIKFHWVWPVTLLALIYAGKNNREYSSKFEEIADYLSKNVGAAKIDELKAVLEKKGYAPLSDEEASSFKTRSVSYTDKPASKSGKSGLAWFLTIVLIIASLIVGHNTRQNKLHSPKQMEINVVSKEVYYDPEARGYTNGCYFINMGYEIEAKKTGIEYVEVKVYVKDKDGNDLGYIKTSLSDLGIDAGDEKVVTAEWKENQPEKNEFFTTLYNAEFSDLEFEYEIGAIRFSDGKSYICDDYNQFN